jgi:hypothetical protein
MNATAARPLHALEPILKGHQAYLEALGQGEQVIVVQIEHPVVQRAGQKLLRHEKLRGERIGLRDRGRRSASEKTLQKEAVRILKSSPGPVILSGMTDPTPSPYELVVRACTLHAGRYRWDIRQIGMPMQSSMESFATAQEAHTDGRQVIEKLTQVSRLGR